MSRPVINTGFHFLVGVLVVCGALLLALQVFVPSHAYAQTQYGLVPCGVDRNNPSTPWDDTKPCQLGHTLLLVKNLIDFTLWKAVPLIIALLAIATGVIFYFSLGDANTLATVRRIWRAVLLGTLILLFSWLFLNFFLGILGFNINIFGQWYNLQLQN